MENLRSPIIFLFVAFIVFHSSAGRANAQGIRLETWQILKTRHTTIKYKSEQDLAQFHSAIEFGPLEWNRSLELEDLTHGQIEKMVGPKVDAIFVRAQEILDMKKSLHDPVNVFLYSDKKALKKAYKSIYQGECRLRAWYRFKTNAVYLNVKDLHPGMLAHELAHAIIDHYLTIKPPSQTAEILARYVDSHLDRGFMK